MNIMILDDDFRFGKRLKGLLSRYLGQQQEDYKIHLAQSTQQARELLADHDFNIAFLDIDLGSGNSEEGIEFLAYIRRTHAHIVCIMVTGSENPEKIEKCLTLGAADYLTKPIPDNSIGYLLIKARTQHRLYRFVEDHNPTDSGLEAMIQVGLLGSRSPAIKQILGEAVRLRGRNTPILITGETGTGKGLLTHHLWKRENQKSRPLVDFDCNETSDSIVESTLFGHVKGAFTGADRAKRGVFEKADGGDLFMDEIGNMPLSIQPKMLRVLNGDPIKPLGSDAARGKIFNFRVIAATNNDLEQMIRDGDFMQDLFMRFNVARWELPPLRERLDDLEDLVRHYLSKLFGYDEEGNPCFYLDESALDFCRNYAWPGNLRELEHTLERAWLKTTGRCITADIMRQATGQAVQIPNAAQLENHQNLFFALEEQHLEGRWDQNINELEKAMIRKGMAKHPKQKDAANYLGVQRHKLGRRIKELGLKSN